MKKFVGTVGVLLCVTFVLCALTACNPTVNTHDGYKAVFNLNYTGAPAATTVYADAEGKVARPTDPTRADYKFAYWSTNVFGTKEFDFNEPLTKNVRLFAAWRQTDATVRFETSGGSVPDAQRVEIGKKAVRPSDPAREDYVFEGWFADAALRTPFDFDGAIEGDTVVYAKWRQVVAKVTFLFYGASQNVVKVDIGGKAQRPAENPTREDYSFRDWYADAACTTVFDFTETITADTTVYAGWKLENATVVFDPNYDGAEKTSAKTPVGGKIARPADPAREGWDFVAWCTDKSGRNAFDFDAAVNDNMTLYANWQRGNVTLTVDYNYDGKADETHSVVYGTTADEPDKPTRSGYAFIGWFNTAACEEYDYFDFTAPVLDNVTAYAGWTTASSASCDIKYLKNDGTADVCGTQKAVVGNVVRTDRIETPVRDGHYFAGWTFDAAGQKKVPAKLYASKSITLYAKWLKKYTFEAEYTDLAGKPGQGSSDNGSGPETLCQGLKDVPGNGAKMGISNGWYVGKLYYNGAFLKFEITAAETVTDATVILRLTPDLFDMSFTPDSYQVLVNDESIPYGNINLTGAIAQDDTDENGNYINGDMNKRPFEDYALNVPVTLNKGNNTIELRTTNSRDHGGTFNAETPLVDCVYIASSASLAWTRCYPENVGQTMSDVKV